MPAWTKCQWVETEFDLVPLEGKHFRAVQEYFGNRNRVLGWWSGVRLRGSWKQNHFQLFQKIII